jgi:hypothetical protein
MPPKIYIQTVWHPRIQKKIWFCHRGDHYLNSKLLLWFSSTLLKKFFSSGFGQNLLTGKSHLTENCFLDQCNSINLYVIFFRKV